MPFLICILFDDHSGLVLVLFLVLAIDSQIDSQIVLVLFLVLAIDSQTDCIINMYVCNDSDKTVAFELAAFSFFFFCLCFVLLPGSNSEINHRIKQQRPGHCF
uniref:Uncharacterized protein n=1 Tax=Pseudo-nitzschia australis TaxID=44445 RepID=A0A7S4AQ66_9STRA